MFGMFGKKPEGEPGEPSAHWDAKRRVLTLVDSKGKRTEKKNPSAMFVGTHEVARMEIGKNKVSFTLHPKVKHEKPRLVSFDFSGNLSGSRVL